MEEGLSVVMQASSGSVQSVAECRSSYMRGVGRAETAASGLYPQAAVSGSHYSEGGGDDDSYGEGQEEYSYLAVRCRAGKRGAARQHCCQNEIYMTIYGRRILVNSIIFVIFF